MMKDKLYKYNHKRFYYLARKLLVVFSVCVGLGTAIAVPTTINYFSTETRTGLAETSKDSEEAKNDSVDSSVDLEESYNN